MDFSKGSSKSKRRSVIKWIIYTLLLFVFYGLQTAPGFFRFLDAQPLLTIPLVLSIAMFEHEIGGAVFGILAGFLWDMQQDTLFGFNALVMMCCCVSVSLLIMYLMPTTLPSSLFYNFSVLAIQSGLYFLFCYALWGTPGMSLVWVNYLLPQMGLTLLASIPIYFLVRLISSKFSESLRS